MTPAGLLDLAAAIMLAVAAASVARLVAATQLLGGGPWRPVQVAADADVAHALMGIAMAGMFTPSLATLPDGAWGAVFGLATAWFAGRAWLEARRDGIRSVLPGRCTLHLIHSAAMLYMFEALSAPAAGGGAMEGMNVGGSAMGTMQYPTLAGVFVLLLIGYSVWDLDQLSGKRFSLAVARGPAAGAAAAAREPAARAFLLAPATQVAWQVVLGVAMALLLVIMI
jgi:hypothetical protein